jgi:hypothetical protein
MEKNLTVAELIAILSKMPQDLEVEMGMNMEYQCGVTADMIEVETFDGRSYVCITDFPNSPEVQEANLSEAFRKLLSAE